MRVLLLLSVVLLAGPLTAQEKKPQPKKPAPPKMVAGKSELLREVPKKFAAFHGLTDDALQVRLHIEGDKDVTAWTMKPDAEFKVLGFWGRADQFRKGERVWVWFDIDRAKKPKGVLMIADELSEQDIHGEPPILEASGEDSITLKPKRGDKRTLKFENGRHPMEKDGALVWTDDTKTILDHLRKLPLGKPVFVQSTGVTAQVVLDPATFEKVRTAQKLRMRDVWAKEGLPGTVVFLHPLGGEMDYMLDHEAIRWGRNLKTGDIVKLNSAQPIDAQVKEVRPWRERTLVRLVTGGFDQSDLHLGQRLTLQVPRPSLEVDTDQLPPDVDRPRQRNERIEWVLASVYCACGVRGDRCTGMFYTLASCNVNACGMPNHVRRIVAEMIGQGLSDRQILENLRKEQGPLLFQPHLLP